MILQVNRKEAVKQLKKEIASTTRAIQRESKKRNELWARLRARLRAICKHDRVLVLSEMLTADYDMDGLWEVVCRDCGHPIEVISESGRRGFVEKREAEGIKLVES